MRQREGEDGVGYLPRQVVPLLLPFPIPLTGALQNSNSSPRINPIGYDTATAQDYDNSVRQIHTDLGAT